MTNTTSRMANKKASMKVPYLRVRLERDRPRGLFRQIPYGAEIEFACAEQGKGFHEIQILAFWKPEGRHVGFADPPMQVCWRQRRVHVDGHQAFTAQVVRDADDDALGLTEDGEDS